MSLSDVVPSAAVAADATARLCTATWQNPAQTMPPTVREILHAYSLQAERGADDREMLLSLLAAKSAEDQRIAALANLAVYQAQQSIALIRSGSFLLGGMNGFPPERPPSPASNSEEGDTLRDECEDATARNRSRSASCCSRADLEGQPGFRQASDNFSRNKWHPTNAKQVTSSAPPDERLLPQDDRCSPSNPTPSSIRSHPTRSRQNGLHQQREVSPSKPPHVRGHPDSSPPQSSGTAGPSSNARHASKSQGRQTRARRLMAHLPISSTFYPSRRKASRPVHSPDRSASSPFPHSSHRDRSRSRGVSKERLLGNGDDSSRSTHRPVSMVREVLENDEDSESDEIEIISLTRRSTPLG